MTDHADLALSAMEQHLTKKDLPLEVRRRAGDIM